MFEKVKVLVWGEILLDGYLINGEYVNVGNIPDDVMEQQYWISTATSEFHIDNGIYVID